MPADVVHPATQNTHRTNGAPYPTLQLSRTRSIPIVTHGHLDAMALLACENPMREFGEPGYYVVALHRCRARRTSKAPMDGFDFNVAALLNP